MEHKQGWASEENSRYTVLETGDLARNWRPKRVQPRQEAMAVEHATGEKSAQRIAQERGHDIIKSATSWPELHQKLAEKGLHFEKKGSGAIVFVGEIAVKASSIDRDFGISKLCKRLGEFVSAEVAPPLERMQPEYAEADKARREHHTSPAPSHTWRPGDAVSAYYAHYENICKHMNVEDFSRVDAMIALRLRAVGHDRQSVVEAIRQCGPTIREKNEGRNWQRYAERTAAYAFGVAGDVALAKNERYVDHWRGIQGVGEREREEPRVRMR